MIVSVPLWLIILLAVLASPVVLLIGLMAGYCFVLICFEVADLLTSPH